MLKATGNLEFDDDDPWANGRCEGEIGLNYAVQPFRFTSQLVDTVSYSYHHHLGSYCTAICSG